MTDDARARLRDGIAWVVRFAALPGTVVGHEESEFHASVMADNYQSAGPLPELTTAQQLALSVLIGEPDYVIANAMAEHLLDQGHEYATAVLDAERRRCLRVVLDSANATDRDGLRSGGMHTHVDSAYVYDHIAATHHT